VPELPEVEVMTRQAARFLQGRHLHDLVVVDLKIAEEARLAGRRSALSTGKTQLLAHAELPGRRVTGVTRLAKWTLIRLEDQALAVHFGMTGRWVHGPVERHVRFWLEVVDEMTGQVVRLSFVDPRRFGGLLAGPWQEILSALRPDGDVPEPWPGRVEGETFSRRTRGSRRAVHAVLLDQTVVAGVGNIMANEALWRAHVHPALPASEVTSEEWEQIAQHLWTFADDSVRDEEAALRQGSIAWVQDGKELPGRFQVYGRQGEQDADGRLIHRTTVGGRSVFWCEHQRGAPAR
jgi:formamidopyrimidine-DNA glycosylase